MNTWLSLRLLDIFKEIYGYFRTDKARIGILCICTVNFAYLLMITPYGSLTWDEGIHTTPAIMVFDYFRRIAEDVSVITPSNTIKFFVDYQRSYWINSNVLFFYPPLYWVLTALIIPFLGINHYSARFVSIISAPFLGIITYELGKMFHNRRTGAIAVILTMSFYEVIQLGASAVLDLPLTTLCLFATYYFWGARKKGDSWYNRSGIFLGLALLMKQSAIIMLLIFLLALILFKGITKTAVKNITRILGFSSVVAGPWYFFVAIIAPYYLTAIWTVNVNQVLGPPWFSISAWYHYGVSLYRLTGLFILMLIFLGIAWSLLRRRQTDVFLLLFVAIILITFTISWNKQFRYILPCIPILFLYVGISIDNIARIITKFLSARKIIVNRKNCKHVLFFLFFVFSFAEFFSINYSHISTLTDRPSLPLEEAAAYIVEHIPSNTNYKYRVLQIRMDNYFSPFAFSFYVMKYDRDHKVEILNPHSIESLNLNPESIDTFVRRERIYYIIFAIYENEEFTNPQNSENYFLYQIFTNSGSYIIEKVLRGYTWIHICHPAFVE
ncbi:MAG: ArnT family glycosyltransferase [Promethearchaeota archaeon]